MKSYFTKSALLAAALITLTVGLLMNLDTRVAISIITFLSLISLMLFAAFNSNELGRGH